MLESWVPLECPCDAKFFKPCFRYDQPVAGEIVFDYGRRDDYLREVRHCSLCGHFIEVHDFPNADLYSGDYVNTTYGGSDGMRQAFEKTMNLDSSRSDNAGRVQRVLDLAASHFPPGLFLDRAQSILDVGSGLCVFLGRMKMSGWDCTALDVDPRQAKHAEDVAGVRAFCGDFLSTDQLAQYDIITFNKVLEHIDEAVATLSRAKLFLRPGGFVYVEVPDGETAQSEGRTREEFLLGHRHVFSATSLAMMGERAGLSLKEMQRLREPSSKFTLWAVFTTGPDVETVATSSR